MNMFLKNFPERNSRDACLRQKKLWELVFHLSSIQLHWTMRNFAAALFHGVPTCELDWTKKVGKKDIGRLLLRVYIV